MQDTTNFQPSPTPACNHLGDSGAATATTTANTTGDDGTGGLDWLALAATGNTSTTNPDNTLAAATSVTAGTVGATPARSPASGAAGAAVSDASGGGGGLDWLTAAKAGAQAGVGGAKTRRGSLKEARKASVSATAPGGWMTSGKLGVSTEDASDDDAAGGVKVDNGGTKKRGARESGKKAIKEGKSAGGAGEAAPAASSGAGGWLASGKLGVKLDDEESDQGDAVDRGDTSCPVMVSLETQTENDIEGIVKRENEPKLPPWAKRWTPPAPEPEEVPPEPTPEAADGRGSAKEVHIVSSKKMQLVKRTRYRMTAMRFAFWIECMVDHRFRVCKSRTTQPRFLRPDQPAKKTLWDLIFPPSVSWYKYGSEKVN